MQQCLQIDWVPPMKGSGQIQISELLKKQPPPTLTSHTSHLSFWTSMSLCKLREMLKPYGRLGEGKVGIWYLEKHPRQLWCTLMKIHWVRFRLSGRKMIKLVQTHWKGGDLAICLKILNAHTSFNPVIPLLEIHCSDNFTHELLTKYYVQKDPL